MQIKLSTTSISANADGPHDAASRKIDHIALPTKYNYQAGNERRSIANYNAQAPAPLIQASLQQIRWQIELMELKPMAAINQ